MILSDEVGEGYKVKKCWKKIIQYFDFSIYIMVGFAF